jgi:uncharacterized protein
VTLVAIEPQAAPDPGLPRGLPWSTPVVDWVVKVSRFCNLRCRYCYEMEYLADERRMSLGQLEQMFEHIAAYYRGSGKRMDFVWHGGEPLLIEAAYYAEIAGMQRRILGGAALDYRNNVQTNLTRLSGETLALLKGFFDGVGVSLDVFGDQRVNIAGRPIEALVKRNLQILKGEGIAFGCISVLSRKNVDHVEDIYRFVEEHGQSVRFLPIYRTGFPGQQEGLALSDAEICDAYRRLVDLWLAAEQPIRLRPLEDHLANVIRKLTTGSERTYYDKLADEVVYIVGTDGALYSSSDAYVAELCHGNIFEDSLSAIKRSESYARAVGASRGRMKAACEPCGFFGSCPGFFMAEATEDQRTYDEHGDLICGVARPIQEYIERRLLETGVFAERPAAG